MKRYALPFFILGVVSLSACTKDEPIIEDAAGSSSSGSLVIEDDTPDAPVTETRNVYYRGIVQPAGISIYQEGTHRLLLEDGRFLLLEGTDIDLNGYVGEEAELFGATRPTVEAGGIIMRVERASLVVKEPEVPVSTGAAVSSEDVSTGSTVASSSPAADPIPEVIPEVPTQASSSAPSTTTPEVVEPTEPTEPETIDRQETISPEKQAMIDAMAKNNMDADQWTQQYCTAHIGFCISVHKNWWFKSFGTTSSHLWHVEISNAEIENLGDGVISVQLLPGSSVSKKATSGQVRVQGTVAIGFLDWTENRHFEIVGPASLEAAIRMMTSKLVSYEENT